MEKETIKYTHYRSVAADMILASYKNSLCMCHWANSPKIERAAKRICKALNADMCEGSSAVICEAISQLNKYFAHKSCHFNFPILLVGTDFQKKVWGKLAEIPYGETISYGQIAKQLSCPKSVRAIANAIGANPISIIIPCHRVIGSNNALTGYAGGLKAKKILLDTEESLNTLKANRASAIDID